MNVRLAGVARQPGLSRAECVYWLPAKGGVCGTPSQYRMWADDCLCSGPCRGHGVCAIHAAARRAEGGVTRAVSA